jgi:hypothetical protein
MKPELREQVRLSLLRYGLRAFSIGLAVQYLKSEGIREADKHLVQDEAQYLEEKGLLKEANKVISPENKQWFTSAAGRDFLAEQGHDE